MKIKYSWIILVLSVLIILGAVGFARFGYTMLLPSMMSTLNLSDVQAGDIATGNMIGYLVMALLCGFLSAHYNSKLIIIISLFFVSLSMFLTGIASDYNMVFLSRVLAGLASGGANIPVMGLIASWFSTKRRGLATGIVVSGSSFGLVITGILIPYILKAFPENGFRFGWYSLAFITLIIMFVSLIFLKNKPSEVEKIPIRLLKEDEIIKSKTTNNNFVHKINKIFNNYKEVLINLRIWILALIYSLFGFSYVIYATFFSRYLTDEYNWSISKAGLLWSQVGMLSIISGFIWGAFSDKIGRMKGIALVYFLQSISFVIFGLWKNTTGFYISALLFALTAWSIPAIIAAAAGDFVGSKLAPAALGFMTLFFGLGQVLGPLIAGRLAFYTSSYSIAFVIAGIAAFFGAFFSMLLKDKEEARS